MKKIVSLSLSALMATNFALPSFAADKFTSVDRLTIPKFKIEYTPAEFKKFPNKQDGVIYSKSGKIEWVIPEKEKENIPDDAYIAIYADTYHEKLSKVSVLENSLIGGSICAALSAAFGAVKGYLGENTNAGVGAALFGAVGGIIGSTATAVASKFYKSINEHLANKKDAKENYDLFKFNIDTKYCTLSDEFLSLFSKKRFHHKIEKAALSVIKTSKDQERVLSHKQEEKKVERPNKGNLNFTIDMDDFSNYFDSESSQDSRRRLLKEKENLNRQPKVTSWISRMSNRADDDLKIKYSFFDMAKHSSPVSEKTEILRLNLDSPCATYRFVLNGDNAKKLYNALLGSKSKINDAKVNLCYQYVVPGIDGKTALKSAKMKLDESVITLKKVNFAEKPKIINNAVNVKEVKTSADDTKETVNVANSAKNEISLLLSSADGKNRKQEATKNTESVASGVNTGVNDSQAAATAASLVKNDTNVSNVQVATDAGNEKEDNTGVNDSKSAATAASSVKNDTNVSNVQVATDAVNEKEDNTSGSDTQTTANKD